MGGACTKGSRNQVVAFPELNCDPQIETPRFLHETPESKTVARTLASRFVSSGLHTETGDLYAKLHCVGDIQGNWSLMLTSIYGEGVANLFGRVFRPSEIIPLDMLLPASMQAAHRAQVSSILNLGSASEHWSNFFTRMLSRKICLVSPYTGLSSMVTINMDLSLSENLAVRSYVFNVVLFNHTPKEDSANNASSSINIQLFNSRNRTQQQIRKLSELQAQGIKNTILLVDDHSLNIRLLLKKVIDFVKTGSGDTYNSIIDFSNENWQRRGCFIFTIDNVNIVCAANGNIAYEVFKHCSVSACITDNEMPLMNGVELITRIRKNESIVRSVPIPIALHSSCSFDPDFVEELNIIELSKGSSVSSFRSFLNNVFSEEMLQTVVAP